MSLAEDRQAKVDAVLRSKLSAEEVERRLNLCPDCLQYDSHHKLSCNNEGVTHE